MTLEYETAIRNEIENWPGVSVTFGLRSKHGQAVLDYQGNSRFVVLPLSPSDSARGAKNSIADVRRECRALGASRLVSSSSAAPREYRKPTPKPRRDIMVERAPVKANPFDLLAQIKFSPPPKRGVPRLIDAIRAFFTRKTGA